jgi:hypothetical protein
MPLSEYLLLAVLASGGAALPGAVPNTTLDADAIVQPNGGGLSSVYPGQDTPPKKSKHYRKLRHQRHHSKAPKKRSIKSS